MPAACSRWCTRQACCAAIQRYDAWSLALVHGLSIFTDPFAVVIDDPHTASCAIIVAPASHP